jgi:N-hydroxyarylamine O-acetyltransferase
MTATFEAIHHAHSYDWAFENLDVFLTGRNGLDRGSLQAKLGEKKRGGWCFELNEWLALTLEDAGFPLRRLMARNAYVPNRPRTHQISLVEVEGQLWTADAGFGAQTPRAPMKLEDGFERVQDGLPYRMTHVVESGSLICEPEAWVLQMKHEGGWRNLYRFTLESATAADFEVGNHFHLTNPTSTFPDMRMVTRLIPGGRLTLVDRSLKTLRNTLDGEVLEHETELSRVSAYGDALSERFGLRLSDKAIDRLFSISRGNAPLEE